MSSLRIDTHAHLYDCFNLRDWVMHAASNLGVSDSVQGVVIVVDRAGQDSFQRLRKEIPTFAEWSEESADSNCLVGTVHIDGQQLFVIQGVQYVTSERLEVLALACQRVLSDGERCDEIIAASIQAGGVVCLPWSPGKWLGSRGKIVSELFSDLPKERVCFGDISVHSRMWPRSRLLRVAHEMGFVCVAGTDALERSPDCELVGRYGVAVNTSASLDTSGIVALIRNLPSKDISLWGAPNDFITATRRFISSLL